MQQKSGLLAASRCRRTCDLRRGDQPKVGQAVSKVHVVRAATELQKAWVTYTGLHRNKKKNEATSGDFNIFNDKLKLL